MVSDDELQQIAKQYLAEAAQGTRVAYWSSTPLTPDRQRQLQDVIYGVMFCNRQNSLVAIHRTPSCPGCRVHLPPTEGHIDPQGLVQSKADSSNIHYIPTPVDGDQSNSTQLDGTITVKRIPPAPNLQPLSLTASFASTASAQLLAAASSATAISAPSPTPAACVQRSPSMAAPTKRPSTTTAGTISAKRLCPSSTTASSKSPPLARTAQRTSTMKPSTLTAPAAAPMSPSLAAGPSQFPDGASLLTSQSSLLMKPPVVTALPAPETTSAKSAAPNTYYRTEPVRIGIRIWIFSCAEMQITALAVARAPQLAIIKSLLGARSGDHEARTVTAALSADSDHLESLSENIGRAKQAHERAVAFNRHTGTMDALSMHLDRDNLRQHRKQLLQLGRTVEDFFFDRGIPSQIRENGVFSVG